MVSLIGSGATGLVYLAVDQSLERDVALKAVAPAVAADKRAIECFRKEAQVVARLASHPNIITVYDIAEDDEAHPFLVTEYLTGSPLSTTTEVLRQPPSRTWTLDVLRQITAALAAAHACGIVHRDIKPANVFLMSTETIPLLVKVIDFGLSKAEVDLVDQSANPRSSQIVGTPMYMSPEVLNGRSATPAVDLYAVGLIAYQLVVGAFPYSIQSVADCYRAHLLDTPFAIPVRRIGYPQSFLDSLLRLLSKDPNDRPTALEFLSAVDSTIEVVERDRWIRSNRR